MTDVGPVGRLGYWTATHFRAVAISWLVIALGLGFVHVEAGPLVRSSYHAHEQADAAEAALAR